MILPSLTDTNAKIRDLLNAHNQLDGYQEVVVDKNGQKVAVPKSYIFPIRAIVDITSNIKVIREHVVSANERRDELLKRLSNGTNEIDPEKNPDAFKEFSKGVALIEDEEVEIKGLRVLRMEDLLNGPLDEPEEGVKKDKDKKTPNRIPQTVLASLSPVLDIFQLEKVD